MSAPPRPPSNDSATSPDPATGGPGVSTTAGNLPPGEPERYHLVVAGAHLQGQPLNHQLTDRGGELVASTTTAPTYRLYALDTDPPKPGLVRVASGGRAIEVEVWSLVAAELASFIVAVPAPLAIGQVELADGTWRTGFTCMPHAVDNARDITQWGGWLAFLAAD